MKFNSIRFKISILYIIILGLILIFYSTVLYLSLHYTLYDELDNELKKKADEIAKTIDAYHQLLGDNQEAFILAVKKTISFEEGYTDSETTNVFEQQWWQKVDILNLREDYINFLDAKGYLLATSANSPSQLISLSGQEIEHLQQGNLIFKSIKFEKRSLRIINSPFPYTDTEQYIIQVGTSLKPVIRLLQIRLRHIIISIPVVLILASFFARIFASRILRPVVEITRTASNITHKDLSARVKAEHVDEEMRYLVHSFNDMISRLEQSFKYIAEFSSHVAHDLKTPLAVIRGESDVALRKERDKEEYKRVIKVTREEAERMLRIIDDLLLLTKLDYRPEFFKFEQFDLIEFLREIYEQSKILASAKNITVNINTPQEMLLLRGDRLHLRRLFFNLIDNAIKFTPKDGRINIDVGQENKKIIISISDTGIGIAPEDIPRVFDRFFHSDRTGQIPELGAGLGLSIAQSIAKMHNAEIKLKTELDKGSTFTIIFTTSS